MGSTSRARAVLERMGKRITDSDKRRRESAGVRKSPPKAGSGGVRNGKPIEGKALKKMLRDEDGEEGEFADLNDIDGLIDRTKQKLENKHLMELTNLKDRLKYLEAAKVEKDKALLRWPGVSYPVALRLDWFSELYMFLLKDGDKYKCIPNIKSITESYKAGTLVWEPGHVTYWSNGKQLTEPRPFDWAEFWYWNTKHNGYEGFWVEGLRNSKRNLKEVVSWPGGWKLPSGAAGGDQPVSAHDQFEDPRGRSKLPVVLRLARPPLPGSKAPDPRTHIDPNRGLINDPDHFVWAPRRPRWPYRIVGEWPLKPKKESRKVWKSALPEFPRKPYEYLLMWMDDDTGSDVCTISDSDLAALRRSARRTDAPRPKKTGAADPKGDEGNSRNKNALSVAATAAGSPEAALSGENYNPAATRRRPRRNAPKGGEEGISSGSEDETDSEEVLPDPDTIRPPLLGYVSSMDASGNISYQPCMALQINLIMDSGMLMLKEWDIIEVVIVAHRPYPASPPRLMGPWLRHRFYTVTAPDLSGRMWILKKWWRTALEVPISTVGDSGSLPGLMINTPERVSLALPQYRARDEPPPPKYKKK